MPDSDRGRSWPPDVPDRRETVLYVLYSIHYGDNASISYADVIKLTEQCGAISFLLKVVHFHQHIAEVTAGLPPAVILNGALDWAEFGDALPSPMPGHSVKVREPPSFHPFGSLLLPQIARQRRTSPEAILRPRLRKAKRQAKEQ